MVSSLGDRFINNVEMNKAVTSYQFPQLMMAIQTAVKCVSVTLKKCGLAQMKTDANATTNVEDKDALQPGKDMLCGGYILYGYCTVLVLAFEGGSVNGFTLDPAVGEFMLTDPMIKIPTSAKLYSVNEGHTQSFDQSLVNFIEKMKVIKIGEAWSARYSGNLVGDCHRILKQGGIYMYPASKEHPNGKHRLLYEASPIAFIMKQAGGLAVNGKQFILDMIPQKLHEKTPFFCGSRDNVLQLMQALGMNKISPT
ncbi:unnamed protein product [Nesidiocoris tenuis]|uniref:Fructose-bisphosphatase n=1 Tax=Nesidiocoris tenuis TaxID=355587 RepID=A0A6H5GBN3_9HEMI|nr:unnamed protein product [Nesidiocoris tenuis]